MFENIKERAFNWALKAQVRADQAFIKLLMDSTPKWSKWTAETAVNEGYKASLWAYAAINKKAKAAASVPWYVYRRDAQGDWEQVKNHPLQQLIDSPNPFTSRNNMIERLIIQLDLAGNSIFKMVKVGGIPVELWSIGPDGVKPNPDPAEFIKNYTFENKAKTFKQDIPADEILHVMYIDPSNPFWGIAPLQVAARTVDTDIEAVNWNKVALQNRAVTDGVFSTETPLSPTQFAELRQQIRTQHQGAANARTPWVLGGGASWQQMSLSPVDMDYIEGRQMNREDICAVFQVPPPLVGILDKANYSNMQEARRVFWLDTIIPLLDDLKESFNRALTPYFGNDIMLDYDTSSVDALAENVNDKIDAAQKLFGMGVPFNMINQRLDLGIDEVEGGDLGYLPASLMPANMAAALAAGTLEAETAPAAPAAPAAPTTTGDEPPELDAQTEKYMRRLLHEVKSGKKQHGRPQLKGYNLRSAEQKAAYYKAFERQRSQWYSKLTKEALALFSDEAGAVSAAFNKSGDLEAALDAINLESWQQFYIKNYMAIIEDFGSATLDGFKGHAPGEHKDWDPFNGIILGYLFRAAAEKVTYVTDFTKQLVKGIVYTGRDNGDSISTIARNLDKGFEEFSTHRSYRIARTEVVAASNYGSFIAADEAAAEVGDLTKEWLDSGDKRVRESHEDVGGETVGLYEKFSNGLLYPGDMENGSGKDVIHCRCTVIYNPVHY